MTLFGRILTGWDVEKEFVRHMENWMTTYIAEVERQLEIPAKSIPPVTDWVTHNEFRKWPDDRIPVGVVISPGLAGEPTKDGEGNYRAKWHLAVAVVVKGRNREEVSENAKVYAAAVRGAVLQHRSLGGFAMGVEWKDESYTDLPSDTERTLGSAQVVFEVEVPETINVFGGLVTTPEDPYEVPGDWPTVKEDGATVTVNKDN